MSPKEKAKELVITFEVQDFNERYGWKTNTEHSKLMAIKAVDEIIETDTLSDRQCGYLTIEKKHKEYWAMVRAEIKSM